MTEYAYEGPKRSTTTVTWSLATVNFSADFDAPYSHVIGDAYRATIQAAFDRWSAVSGLSFTQVADSAGAAIRLGFGIFALPSELGETIVRSVGGYLPNDTVIRLLDPAVDPLVQDAAGTWFYNGSDITLLQIATHEIGHALGLAHTTDPTTIMYPVASDVDASIAPGDIEGINGLYPLYTVNSPDAVQVEGNSGTTEYDFVVTRHNDLNLATSVNYQISGAAYPGVATTVAAPASAFVGGAYPSGTLNFAAGVASLTLTVNVAANTLPQPDQGFALSLSSTSAITTATARGSLNAMILDDDGSATVSGPALPIYRFFDASDGTHFFTASEAERKVVLQSRPDLVYEGPDLTALANPGSDPAAVPIYRFFDTVHGTHFYTASSNERDTVLHTRPDLTDEGVAFYEDSMPRAGDSAVYRFFDTRSGTQFLTATAAERATILSTLSGYVDEGVAFYAPASA